MARDTALYNILGLSPDCSEADIKRAYRKLAVQYHPDKNPDPSAIEKFKEINRAYEVLSDEQKRSVYDRYGEAGLEGNANGGMNPHDIFRHFFGGSPFGDSFGGSSERRGKDVVHALPVTLEDLYLGRSKKLALTKQVVCGKCKGSGSKVKGKAAACPECKGAGVKVTVRQMGPMIQQMQSACPKCKGEGTYIDDKDRCGECSGNRVKQEKKILEVHVDRGMKHNDKVTFSGEGDQHPDLRTPGDVIIVLQEKKHERFVRNGADLAVTKALSLREALCGFSFPLRHLDGRVLLIKSRPGEIIQPGATKVIPNEGMPKHRNPFDKGQLLISFSVEMPASLPPAAADLLAKVLPGPTQMDMDYDPSEAEECFVHDHVPDSGRRGTQQRMEEDDDGSPHGQRAQCVHQ